MATTQVTKRIKAPRAAVYRALTTAEDVRRWMVPDNMTSNVHEFDATEGGVFRISLTYDEPGETGKTRGNTDTFTGRFTRLVPDEEVAQAIEFETDDPDVRGEMTITYTLTPTPDGGTEVVGRHENLPPGVSVEDNETGWRMSLDKLARLVEGR